MNHEFVLAALRLLSRLLEASKALLELLRQQGDKDDGGEGVRKRPRHLKQ